MSDSYVTPEWAKHIIWYQIFPERFYNGDTSNDPTRDRVQRNEPLPKNWDISPWTSDWYFRADWERELGPDFEDSVFDRRYGGDLQGIIDKLDYLQELGIGAIYLNPIFDAVSLHKYDTSYYRHVDRFFGPDPKGDTAIIEREDPRDTSTWQWTSADQLFLKLIDEVHTRGMKIIIDGVFNHTGTDFWAFRDLEKNQQESPFKDWYDVTSFRDNGSEKPSRFEYSSWWGVKSLPELKQTNGTLVPPVREHIANITRRWMDPNGDGDPSDGVDGWRLDVPEEIGTPFWEEWCRLVRNINPDAYIAGEIWDHKATGYVSSALFTAVMNYQFAEAVQCYMIDKLISARDFSDWLTKIRENFPDESNYVMLNLMDSHDTPRLASMIINPGREYDTLGHPKDGFNVRKPTAAERRVQRLIVLFQFTYIGVPMIYYGDEAGMWGADDPDNRKPMLWPEMQYRDERIHPLGKERAIDENTFDHSLFDYYKKLASIRNKHTVLQTGRFKELLVDSDRSIFCFSRHENNSSYAVIVVNCSDNEQQISLSLLSFRMPKKMIELLSGNEYEIHDGNLHITVPPVSGRILLPDAVVK